MILPLLWFEGGSAIYTCAFEIPHPIKDLDQLTHSASLSKPGATVPWEEQDECFSKGNNPVRRG
jgi:hypothetical protein